MFHWVKFFRKLLIIEFLFSSACGLLTAHEKASSFGEIWQTCKPILKQSYSLKKCLQGQIVGCLFGLGGLCLSANLIPVWINGYNFLFPELKCLFSLLWPLESQAFLWSMLKVARRHRQLQPRTEGGRQLDWCRKAALSPGKEMRNYFPLWRRKGIVISRSTGERVIASTVSLPLEITEVKEVNDQNSDLRISL